jgi:chemotaxis protein CheX
MDVRYISPFLQGTTEVLKKMTAISIVPGKPYAKKHDIAPGDVSGVIGITGDAVGSLAISFSQTCICSIVTSMLGEFYSEVTKDVVDAVGEITNMISGVARSRVEKDGMILHAAIPTVVFGKDHTVRHILSAPSIVIPFMTPHGNFFVDVCLKTAAKKENAAPPSPETPAATGGTAAGPAKTVKTPDTAKMTPEEKIEYLRRMTERTAALREDALKKLAGNPFMPFTERKKLNQAVAHYEAAIKRLKLDISAVSLLSSIDMKSEVRIRKHYQHYDGKKKN